VTLRSRARRLRTAAALAVVVACAGAHAQRPDEATLARIEQLVGTARCETERQCRAVGLGSRPCGGPERYLAWSVAETDERTLMDLAATYAEQRRALNEAIGRLGTCSILPEPGVRCEPAPSGGRGRCVVVPGTRGGAALR
jgi:cytochrome c553